MIVLRGCADRILLALPPRTIHRNWSDVNMSVYDISVVREDGAMGGGDCNDHRAVCKRVRCPPTPEGGRGQLMPPPDHAVVLPFHLAASHPRCVVVA